MKEYHTQIEINAPIKKVWDILTDFPEYPNWNPLVSKLSGNIRKSGTIKTTIVPLNRTYTATLLSFKKNKEIIWEGKRIAKFLLKGKHYYRLAEKEKNVTTLEHGERFTGLFSSFISSKLMAKMEQAFIAHNKALKLKAEDGK